MVKTVVLKTAKSASAKLPPGTLQLVQLTDTHLYAEPDRRLLGLCTLECLREVSALVANHHNTPDLILATGDIVHDATPEAYRLAARELLSLGAPVFSLPGNHDVPETMCKTLEQQGISCSNEIVLGNWQILMLNSVIPGEEGGRLASEELERLARQLEEGQGHVLVCLHHQPVKVGSAWIDTMALENADEFFAVLDACPRVRGVLWGHIHQDYEQVRNGVRLMASPSTCVQFTPGVDDFQVDLAPPGYRYLALLPDGTIITEVKRLDAYPEGLELASSGY